MARVRCESAGKRTVGEGTPEMAPNPVLFARPKDRLGTGGVSTMISIPKWRATVDKDEHYVFAVTP